MPDHLHMLVHGLSETADLRAFASRAKQFSAYEYSRARGQRLWQPSYYDHLVREGEDVLGFMAYIAMNPVVAGLAKRPEDYALLGSLTLGREEMLRVLREFAPLLLLP